MNAPSRVCRTTAVALRYWAVVALLAWTVLSVIGLAWHPLRPTGAATILTALSIGCFANYTRNRTCHCAFTAPLLLGAAGLFLLGDLQIVSLRPAAVWITLSIGLGIAFLLEWRFARTSCGSGK